MPQNSSTLHPRNFHRDAYHFDELIIAEPTLKHYVFVNQYGTTTINFNIAEAVKLLNKALLKHFYGIAYWDLPAQHLCPPIPGRADYVHYLADLLTESFGKLPFGEQCHGLDIGVGASMIFPIIAQRVYGWQMLGSDINISSLENAELILTNNDHLQNDIKLKLQPQPNFIFKNIIDVGNRFAFTMCNPPFHSSEAATIKGNVRKNKNLNNKRIKNYNFGGQQSELWCEGGEVTFIARMIEESTNFAQQVLWFTTLVSKKENLMVFQKILKSKNIAEIKIIDMAQGQKNSRILAWTFIKKEDHAVWLSF